MAQYIIDVNEKNISETGELLLYGEMQGSGTQVFHTGLFVDPLNEELKNAENKGISKAWRLAGKIMTDDEENGMTDDEKYAFFDVKNNYQIFERPYDTIAKGYATWLRSKEAKDNSIHVGDEVKFIDDGTIGIIINASDNETPFILFADGSCGEYSTKNFILTGNYYDEAVSLLDTFKKK